MEEIEKEINIHQMSINKLSNVISKEGNTDSLLNLSKEFNKENEYIYISEEPKKEKNADNIKKAKKYNNTTQISKIKIDSKDKKIKKKNNQLKNKERNKTQNINKN